MGLYGALRGKKTYIPRGCVSRQTAWGAFYWLYYVPGIAYCFERFWGAIRGQFVLCCWHLGACFWAFF